MASNNATSEMTPEQMANTPAAVPPDGVIPNLSNPPSNRHILIIVGSIVMGIMLATAGLRFYAKVFIRRKMSRDDWTTLVALIGTCLYFIICTIAVVMGKYGCHMWDLSVAHAQSDVFIICGFFTNWFTAVVWPFAKSSFFLMYLDLFKPLRWQRYAIYLGAFVNWGFYISIMIATLYFTSPAPGQSWQESFASRRYHNALNMTIPIAAGSLVLDVYILLLPMTSIWPLKMSMGKKLGVLAVFATGLTACVASSLSIYFKYKLDHHTNDYSYYTVPVLIMCLVEMCVGITASCMPSMVLLYRRRGGPLGERLSTSLGRVFRWPSSESTVSNDGSESSSKTWLAMKPFQKSTYAAMDEGSQPDHFRRIETLIESGDFGPRREDGGIHLKYGFVQNVGHREVV